MIEDGHDAQLKVLGQDRKKTQVHVLYEAKYDNFRQSPRNRSILTTKVRRWTQPTSMKPANGTNKELTQVW